MAIHLKLGRAALLSVLASALMQSAVGAPKSAERIFAEVSRSTVTVLMLDGSGQVQKLGSGVVIASGEVITNCHVVEGQRIQVRHAGEQLDAELRYADRSRDLCQLHVAKLRAPAVARSPAVRIAIGARVFAVGAPQGLELSISDGLISGFRDVDGLSGVIQTTAPISPGSSGGGLYDDSGALVGITTFYLATGQNLNFAMPAAWIDELPARGALPTQPAADEAIEAANLELAELGREWRANDRDYEEKVTYIAAAVQSAMDSGLPAEQWVPIARQAYVDVGFANRVRPYLDKSDWQNVRVVAVEWTRASPSNAAGWYFLGRAHTGFAAAINQRSLETGQRRYESSANVELQLATMEALEAQRQQEISLAIEAYREAVRLQPRFSEAWVSLGFAYSDRNDAVGLLTVMEKLKEFDPNAAAVLSKALSEAR